ncbi:MAG: phosphonate ABC transporter ATP-binding protein [Chloroflexota bacterium]
MASSAEAIRAEGLSRTYPNGVAGLRGLDLTVRQGEVVGLLGRSGSGKTTLFRLLVGAIRPSVGQLTVLGTSLPRARPGDLRALRRRVAWVGQQHNLVPGLSVGHNVLLGRLGQEPLWRVLARLLHLPEGDRRAAFAVLDELGVADKLYDRADDLSGGQQQRVAVARALIGNPEILLADEPVASVDEQTAADVLAACLRANREHGTTLLVSLHQPDLAMRLCPRIVVLEAGAKVYDGPPDGIDRATLYAHADTPGAARSTDEEEDQDGGARHAWRSATA